MEAPASTLCICDVYAKWCGPCVALGKRITNLASDYMEYDIKFVEVCADEVQKFKSDNLGSKPLIMRADADLHSPLVSVLRPGQLVKVWACLTCHI